MYLKIFLVYFFVILSFLGLTTSQVEASTGFVPGNIWYSKDPFEEGDKIKIYTVIFNSETEEFSGTVAFYDETTLLGKKAFSVPARGVKDVSIDWTVAVGDHKIYGKIENAKYTSADGKQENVTIAGNTTEESSRDVKKKIIIQAKNQDAEKGLTSVEKFGETVIDKTPSIIKTPIASGIDTLEGFRGNTASNIKDKKAEVTKQIQTIEDKDKQPETKNKEGEEDSTVARPLKQAHLFFLKVADFVFSNKLVYYSIFFLILFYMARRVYYLFVN